MSLYRPHAPITERTGFLERVRAPESYNPLFYVRVSEAGHTDSMLVPCQAQIEGFFPNWVRVAAAAVAAGNRNIRVAVQRNNGSWWITRVLADDETEYDSAGAVVPPPAAIDVGDQHEVATNERVREWSEVGNVESLLEVSSSEAIISYTDTDADVQTRLHVDTGGIELSDSRTELVSDRGNNRFIVQRAGRAAGTLRPVVVSVNPALPTRVNVVNAMDQVIGSWDVEALLRLASALQLDDSGVVGGTAAAAPGTILTPQGLSVRLYSRRIPGGTGLRSRSHIEYRKELRWVDNAEPTGTTGMRYRAIEFDRAWEGADLRAAMPALEFSGAFSLLDNRYLLDAQIPRSNVVLLGTYSQVYDTPSSNNRFRVRDGLFQRNLGATDAALQALFHEFQTFRFGGGLLTGIVTEMPYAGTEVVRIYGSRGLGDLNDRLVSEVTVARPAVLPAAQQNVFGATTVVTTPAAMTLAFSNATLRAAGWEFRQAQYQGRQATGTIALAELRAEHIEAVRVRGWTVRSEFDAGLFSNWSPAALLIQMRLRPGYFLRRA